ncbi:MAG: hypothetical protein ACR2NX_05875 [Chthoniobacterales bacterium]
MTSRSLCFVLAFVLLLTTTDGAPNEQKEIEALYRRGLAGDKAAVEQCIGKLKTVLQGEPQNQLARVYLGSALTLRSRDQGFGPKKISTLKQGVALMNEAVAAAPDDPKIRLTRALTTEALPAIFGYPAESRKDFGILAQLAETQPTKFASQDLPIVFYHAGLVAKANGDRSRAATLWGKGLELSRDPALSAKLNEELNELH